jgi:hypothetical protein
VFELATHVFGIEIHKRLRPGMMMMTTVTTTITTTTFMFAGGLVPDLAHDAHVCDALELLAEGVETMC